MHPATRIVHASFATEEAVYGVILVAGMIVVSGGHGESSWSVFSTVIVTVLVFWAAHVYAGTVAHHGLEQDRITPLGEAFRICLLYTSPSPRDGLLSRMPSSA